MVFTQIENRKQSFVATSILFLLMFLAMYFLHTVNTITDLNMLEGGGGGGDVAVNFGDSDVGMGDNYASLESARSAAKQPKVQPSAEKEIVVSENDDAPVIANVKKPLDKPKKEETPKVVEKATPKPSKSTTDALSNLLNGSSSGGDGDDKVGGNKGKSYGNPNATGYNGGGGSGTGSGGGNGSGQGLGTGSGYGSGSGGGRGNGNGNYMLGNRKPLSKPKPAYLCNEEGQVAVKIWVDRNGRVSKAEAGDRGTTNRAKCLADQAERAALDTRWESDEDANELQVGKIIYNFKLTD